MIIKKKLAILAGSMFAVTTVFAQQQDWLVNNTGFKAAVNESNGMVTVSNGLLSRSFVLAPNVACTDFRNLSSGEQMLRAVKPEARITLNGKTYNVGGLYGQPQQAYLLPAWLKDMKSNASDFQYASHTVTPIVPYVNWKPKHWALNKKQPSGKTLIFTYTSRQPELKGVRVLLRYEVYDGIPLLCKWLSIENSSGAALQVNQVVNEMLATPEEESAVVGELN